MIEGVEFCAAFADAVRAGDRPLLPRADPGIPPRARPRRDPDRHAADVPVGGRSLARAVRPLAESAARRPAAAASSPPPRSRSSRRRLLRTPRRRRTPPPACGASGGRSCRGSCERFPDASLRSDASIRLLPGIGPPRRYTTAWRRRSLLLVVRLDLLASAGEPRPGDGRWACRAPSAPGSTSTSSTVSFKDRKGSYVWSRPSPAFRRPASDLACSRRAGSCW